MKNKLGFSIIEVMLLVVVLAIVGFVGYTYFSRQSDNQSSVPAKVATDIPEAPQIKTADDLKTTGKILDDIDLDDKSDSSDLDSALNSF